MKTEKEKYLIYSMVILILGWMYFFIINYLNHSDFFEQFNHNDGIIIHIPRRGKYDTIWFKLIAIGFGIVSLYFGYKSKPHNQRRLRILLILMSLLLIIMSILVFPNLIGHYLILTIELFGGSNELLSFINSKS